MIRLLLLVALAGCYGETFCELRGGFARWRRAPECSFCPYVTTYAGCSL